MDEGLAGVADEDGEIEGDAEELAEGGAFAAFGGAAIKVEVVGMMNEEAADCARATGWLFCIFPSSF